MALSLFGLLSGGLAVWLLRENFKDKKSLRQQLDHEQAVRSSPKHDEIEPDTDNE